MPKFQYGLFLTVFYIFLLNINGINGIFEPGGRQLFPVPVPVPDEKQLAWNTRVIKAMPPNFNYFNKIKSGEVLVSDQCNADFLIYEDALSNYKAWALQMFDASTKMPEGIASGTNIHLGNFDQCLDVRAYNNEEIHIFNGHYCGTWVSLYSPIYSVGMQIASCFPSTCTHEDLAAIIQAELNPIFALINVTVGAGINPADCYIEGDKEPLGAASWVVVSILIILGLVVIVSTTIDTLKIKISSGAVDSIMQPFSLSRNMKLLTNLKHGKGTIECMHGIRVGSLLWVILGHRYSMQNGIPKINNLQSGEMFNDFLMQILFNAMPSVDTFFFMSGFLVCYLLMKDLNKGNKFNPIMYYVHRYLRLTTSYALVIGFFATLVGDIGYGPRWRPTVDYLTQICKDTWWTGLLYVDNFVHLPKYYDYGQVSSCIGQGWYLACDMQFAWVAPLVLLPLFYWPKWSTKGLIVLILAACFAPFTITYINKFYMTNVFFYDPQYFKFFTELYIASYMRATPYLMGIGLAYIIFKNPEGIKIPKWLLACGWVLSTGVAIAVIFSPTMMYQTGYEYNRVGSAFYAGFHRLAWSAVIGWIILACHYGYGGFINKILSWGGWLPLSRLSYSMFLVHFYIMYYDLIQVRTLIYFNHFSALQRFFGDIIYSAILGGILHVLIEAPTLGILKIFLKRPASTEPLKSTMKTP